MIQYEFHVKKLKYNNLELGFAYNSMLLQFIMKRIMYNLYINSVYTFDISQKSC